MDGMDSDITQKKSLGQSDIDDGDVLVLGLGAAPSRRRFTGLEITAVGYNICSSWLGIAASFTLAVASGGSVTLLYGIILVSFVFVCNGGTLAELASVYPTAGGQYHFASILAPQKYSRPVSYVCGLFAVFSWIVTIAAVAVLLGQEVLAIVLNYVDSYRAQSWHLFLAYLAFSTLSALYNVLLLKRSAWIYDVGMILSLTLFAVVTVTCSARAQQRPSTAAVWTTIVNDSGWPDGVLFLIGTLTPQFMFVGFDGALHLAEECLNPSKVVPKAILITVGIGFVTAFSFAIGMSYSITELDVALNSRTGSDAAATVFMGIMLICGSITLIAIQQSASRMTWAFARDKAMHMSGHISRMNAALEVPVYALLFNYAVVILIGILIVASSTVFNAIIGSCALLQQLSFGIPAGLLLYKRFTSSQFLPRDRSFRMPNIIGYIANSVVIIWSFIALVFYILPPALPVTGSSMNYTVAVLAVIVIFAAVNWFTYGRKHYKGPRIELME
ncbi:hypothetical protein NQ176_g1620 [Zarea fungicola]|uniref:Uncharacterized protein n=1 Tax=Zarea fungicola TaxID=93591 RepID=A0ACC1NS01_9HYPO|nr:hypothetical protein NQ176_g1620 [Lecanicillium fungicola]